MMLLECSFVKIYRHAYISHLHELFTSCIRHVYTCTRVGAQMHGGDEDRRKTKNNGPTNNN
jgi:hypothetical protein